MKTIILSAHRCEGTYQGKLYSTGRLVLANFEGNAKYPAYITIAKTSAEMAEAVKAETPLEASLSYDAYRRVSEIRPVKGGE